MKITSQHRYNQVSYLYSALPETIYGKDDMNACLRLILNSEVEQMSQTISLSIMSVTISPIILFQLYSPSVPIPHRLQIGFS